MSKETAMKEYPNIETSDILEKIRFTEKILQKYGAEHADVYAGHTKDDVSACKAIHQNLWKIKEEYIRVDTICFPHKPFLVLEFSENPKGSFEDADPFPYDLKDTDLEAEIKSALESLKRQEKI